MGDRAPVSTRLRLGSFFSGVAGFELAFRGLGAPHFQSEIDRHAAGVLATRFPNVRNLGDIREISSDDLSYAAVDCIVAGFPCTDLSIAGKRLGLAGPSSGLFFDLMRHVAALRPRWLLVENVPRLLSSNGGRDFATVLGSMGDLGYGVAWRVLDAQHFGVPQRRRRLFLVAHLGDPAPAAEVLLEPSRGCRHPAPLPRQPRPLAGTARSRPCFHRRAEPGRIDSFVLRGRAAGTVPESGGRLSHCLRASSGGASRQYVALAVSENQRAECRLTPVTNALTCGGGKPGQGYPAVLLTDRSKPLCVRRLTPRECERLMGLPDDWTLVNVGGKPLPDSARYRLCGNAVVVPVVRWIARRLAARHRGPVAGGVSA